MSIIDELKLSPEDVEKIVLLFCKAAIKNRLQERTAPFKVDDNAPLAARILAFINAQPEKQCKQYQISHKFKHTPHIRRLAVIQELLQAGEIKTKTIKANRSNRKTVIYFVEN